MTPEAWGAVQAGMHGFTAPHADVAPWPAASQPAVPLCAWSQLGGVPRQGMQHSVHGWFLSNLGAQVPAM